MFNRNPHNEAAGVSAFSSDLFLFLKLMVFSNFNFYRFPCLGKEQMEMMCFTWNDYTQYSCKTATSVFLKRAENSILLIKQEWGHHSEILDRDLDEVTAA